MKLLNKLYSTNIEGIDKLIVRIFGLKFTFKGEKYAKKYCISREEWIDYIEKINGSQYANEGDSLFFLRDKTILLNRLGNMLKRDFIDIDKCTFDEFEKFIANHKKFIAKEKTGGGGINMKIYDLEKKPKRILKLYSVLKKNKTCLLEEYIQQCEILDKIYPKIVSTVRIYTLNINGAVELISYPLLRIPTASAGIRNEDLVSLKINPNTGVCSDYCVLAKKNKKRIVKNFVHPYSKYPLAGFKVPFFEEIKQLALNAAKLIPEIVYAGWDIAITDNGPVVVEGNGAPYSFREENFLTTYEQGIGRTEYYKEVLEYCNFKKTLTPEIIKEIENKVFLPNVKTDLDYDLIIILGSSACEYRAQYFCDLYKNSSEIPKVIASGGNNYSGKYEYEKISNILIQNNIPAGNIIEEKNAKNSKQNLIYSFKIINKLLSKNTLNSKNKKLKIGIITAGFHSVRINKMADKYRKKYDISVLSAYGENTSKDNWYKSFTGYKIIKDELNKISDDAYKYCSFKKSII